MHFLQTQEQSKITERKLSVLAAVVVILKKGNYET